MSETFFEKWKHRICDAWRVLTGRAWVGYGNPMDWEYREGSWKEAARRALLAHRSFSEGGEGK